MYLQKQREKEVKNHPQEPFTTTKNKIKRGETKGKIALQKMLPKPHRLSLSLFSASMQNQDVVQCKALKQGEFHVVGEDHIESGGKARRFYEKEIIKRLVGYDNYWLEHEYEQDGEYGDSPFLRIQYGAAECLSLIKDSIDYIINYRHLGAEEIAFFKPYRQAISFSFECFYGDCECYNFQAEHGYISLINAVEKLHETAVIFIKNAKGLPTSEPSLMAAIQELETLLEGRNEDDFSTARTRNMERVVSQGKLTPGVWKIGQDHVREWKAPKTGRYQVITQDEFNADYEEEMAEMALEANR